MILTAEALAVALNRTERPITLLDGNMRKVRDLFPEDVGALIAAGYEAGGSKRRVRYLKPPAARLEVRPELPYQKCWRNTEAAVLWPWEDAPGA